MKARYRLSYPKTVNLPQPNKKTAMRGSHHHAVFLQMFRFHWGFFCKNSEPFDQRRLLRVNELKVLAFYPFLARRVVI